jgi:hypothetical protein
MRGSDEGDEIMWFLRSVPLLAVALACAACPSSGGRAAVTWSRSFGGPNGDEAAAAIPTSDGGYLFAGTTAALHDSRDVLEDAQVDGELWVVKLDSSGNTAWERTYGEPFLSPAGNRVRHELARGAEDGGTWLSGNESASLLPTGDALVDGGNLVVTRLGAAAEILWQRTYDSGPFRSYPFTSSTGSAHETVSAIAPAPDGGLFVAAWISARVDKPLQDRRSVEVNAIWVAKLDEAGDVLWDTHLVSDEDGVEYDRFFPHRAGATIHVGLCASGEGGALVTAYSSAHPDSRIARLQSDGSLLWSRTRIEGHVRAAAAIDDDGDGVHSDGFVLAGADDPFGGEDGFLTRLDIAGNPLWSIADGRVEGFDSVAQGEFIDSDGLEEPAIAATGTRPDDGSSGFTRVGLVRFQSLDGSHEDAIDPYLVEGAPALRYDADRWEVLGIAGQEAFVNGVARDLDFLAARFLERIPDARTVELLGDGSVLDIDLRHPTPTTSETVLTRQGPDGRIALEREFAHDGRFVERAHAVVELSGGGYAVLGESSSFGSRAGAAGDGSERAWLLLLDEDGGLVRQRLFEDVALGRFVPAERLDVLTATRDGGLAFAARVAGHIRVVRLDGSGEELWNSEPLSPERGNGLLGSLRERPERPAALIETAEGGFALVGSTDAALAWVARLDAQGTVLWRRTFEPPNERAIEATTIVEIAGGLAVGGTQAGEPWLMVLDGAGSVQRTRFYPLGGSAAGPSCQLARAADGTLLLGTSWVAVEEPADSIDDGAESTGRVNVLLLALDGEQRPLWYRVYGGLYDETLARVEPVPEGGWLIAGRSDSLGDRSEAWLLRVDFEGLITDACNAYLEGGPWPGLELPIGTVAREYLPDVRPGELDPAALSILETAVQPRFPAVSVVARQCAGFTPPGGGGIGEGSFTLTLVFEGGGGGQVVSSPAGIDCRATCSARFPSETRVTLTPSVDPESFFSHWEGADEDLGIEGCAVTMTSNRTVTVFFE